MRKGGESEREDATERQVQRSDAGDAIKVVKLLRSQPRQGLSAVRENSI